MPFIKNLFAKKEHPLREWRDGSHCLPYMFRPAKNPDSPLLVVFHGNGNNSVPSKFHSDHYNVLCPLDRYGVKGNGCWFLGERNDFFMLKMIGDLIGELAAKSNGSIYFWGSSMGGYAAIIYGLLFQARAVFCHIPQTNLHNSHWYQKNRPFIEWIFDSKDHPYRDIPKLVRGHKGIFPLFFLSFNRFDRPFYNEEHLAPMQKALDDMGKNYALLIHPYEGHANFQSVAQQVANFELYKGEIGKYYEAQTGCAIK